MGTISEGSNAARSGRTVVPKVGIRGGMNHQGAGQPRVRAEVARMN